jgi:hypothetical protein
MQYWIKHTGYRLVIIFEGRDAAGKGGTIKRIADPLNPRGCRVVALGTPSDREKTQWYFQPSKLRQRNTVLFVCCTKNPLQELMVLVNTLIGLSVIPPKETC